MHIPDGYLSPQTCAVAGAAMVPVWVVSARRVKKKVKQRDVPLMAIGAAFCFLVMMLNVPIPDGTTAHAVGGVLVAVLLGPEAAVIAVSVALAIQALFFGDGGILAFGANCFSMAFVLPVVGYGVYRLLSRRRSLTDPRRAVAAGIGGYVGINAAALFAAIELGLQPDLFHDRPTARRCTRRSTCCQTIPAMMLAHLTVAGCRRARRSPAGSSPTCSGPTCRSSRINHANVPQTRADVDPARGRAAAGAGPRSAMAAVMVGAHPARPARARRRVRGGLPRRTSTSHKYGLNGRARPGLDRYNGFWSHALLGRLRVPVPADHRTVGYLASAGVGIAVIVLAMLAVWAVASRLRSPRMAARPRAEVGQ